MNQLINVQDMQTGSIFAVLFSSLSFMALVSTGLSLYNSLPKDKQKKWDSLKNFSIILLVAAVLVVVYMFYATARKGIASPPSGSTKVVVGAVSVFMLGVCAAFLDMYNKADKETKDKFTAFRNFLIVFITTTVLTVAMLLGHVGLKTARASGASFGNFPSVFNTTGGAAGASS